MGTTNFDIVDAAGGVTVNGVTAIDSSGNVVGAIVAPAGSISNAELADMATKTYKGRTVAGTGAPSDISVTTLKADLALDQVANAAQVTAVTGSAPVSSSGGTTPAISMAAATAVANGYMTSTYAAKLDGIAASANNYVHPNHTGAVTSTGDGATAIAADAIKTGQLAYAVVGVTVSTGQTVGSSAAAPNLVGGTILGITPAGNQDQFVDDVSVAGDGAVTVTLGAAGTGNNVFNVTVLRAI